MELMINIIVYGTLMGMFIATISALIYFLIKINQRDEEDKGWCIGEEPHEDYECNKCGLSIGAASINPYRLYKYCPHCGEKMEV